MPTRSSGRPGRRPGLATQVLCGVLSVGLSVSTVYAQAQGAGQAPHAAPAPPSPPAPPAVPGDPWTSSDGTAPPPAYGADAYGAPQAGYPGAPGAAGGMIQVDIKADEPGVRLDRVQAPGVNTPVCTAPCSRLVPRNNLYVIDGEGIRTTSQFLLPDDRNQVTLDVKAGSSARHGGGAALLVGGLVIGYVGLVTVASTAAADTATGNSSGRATSVGGALLVGGIAAAIGGLYLVMTSSTKVISSTGSTFSEDGREQQRARPAARTGIALTPRGLTF